MEKKNTQDGLVLVETDKYKNILVTHHFCGGITPENALQKIVISKLREKKIIQ